MEKEMPDDLDDLVKVTFYVCYWVYLWLIKYDIQWQATKPSMIMQG